ncbi:MAG: ABC transporter ATP-binding protein [Anaerolinea sp.]|nr:ABC transporter ATP-binding protein [Anaerolinea sp.]
MAVIQVRNLVKQFNAQKFGVKDVSFDVKDGEFLALVGPSGCGKTTTLRLLAGLEPVSSGEIRFGDRLVNEIRPRDRNVAMVFQDYAVFPHLTVFENIAYGLRARGGFTRYEIDQRVTNAAKMFRIEPLLKRKPRQLSGGERQRVALARAVARDAEVYLFDEPLSNLDAQLRHQAREDIMLLHEKKPKPTVYVTHDQSEAMALGDRIAVMRSGKLEQIGTGTELYSQPNSLFVAFFIGAPSINLFDGKLVADGTDIYVECAPFKALLSRQMIPKVSAHVGKTVKVGVRPEDMHAPKQAPFAVTDDNTIHGVLNEIEPSASGCVAYLTSAQGEQDYVATFRIRLPASYLGKDIPLGINMEKIHLFDAETERSLLYG